MPGMIIAVLDEEGEKASARVRAGNMIEDRPIYSATLDEDDQNTIKKR